MDGVLQVAKNNDAAMNIDLSARSDKWKCLLDSDGEPIRIDANNGGSSSPQRMKLKKTMMAAAGKMLSSTARLRMK